MYTLFQSIAANMPTTAYLKLLDYYLIFAMIMPFAVFSILITWELMDEYDYKRKLQNRIMTGGEFVRIHKKIIKIKEQRENTPETSTTDGNSYKKRPSDETILRHMKWFLPLLTVVFITLYSIIVIYVYE